MAAAAYRSGERLYDSLQGKWFAFERDDVFHNEILAPAGAPDWVFNRQMLWNTVERCEKRCDAQLAREIEITLPRELTREQCITLVREFVNENYVRKGMVADIGIHCPSASDGQEQPHAHVMLTLRRLDPTTPSGFAKQKSREWNEDPDIARAVAEARKRFNNTGLETDKLALDAVEAQRNVNQWRKAWADTANKALREVGSTARIDHRTLEAQGIFRPPLTHIGLARHIENAYAYLRDRITQWVAVKKRAMIWREAQHYKNRDPTKLAELVLRLSEMAEDFAAGHRHPPPNIPEVSLDR